MIKIPENSDRLLLRQIKKTFPDGTYTEEGFDNFISLVNSAYRSMEDERSLYMRAEKISNKELEEANIALRTKNDFLDTFNHGMAHDIKNHTANIIGLASMLKKYSALKNKEMLDTIIEKIDLSANQLTLIVQGFLYLSRAESNIDNQFVVIDGEEIKNAVKAETLFLLIDKQCTINYHFELNNLFFSFHVLKIIFVNLISNSIKFSKRGELIVVDVSLKHNEKAIQLIVKDNGIGMDLTDPKNRIFELFNRGENAKVIKGTGIGLFMIRKIIERHNGKVEVKSELGRGTTFHITFPIA